jgi:hypothetical protein
MKPTAKSGWENSSDKSPIKNCLKQGDVLLPLILNFALEYDIRRIQANYEGLKLTGIFQFLVYADDVDIYRVEACTL